MVLDNILQVQNPVETTNMIIAQNDVVQMDVDDLIIEDPENTPEQSQGKKVNYMNVERTYLRRD